MQRISNCEFVEDLNLKSVAAQSRSNLHDCGLFQGPQDE
jgi:hypothetical protein